MRLLDCKPLLDLSIPANMQKIRELHSDAEQPVTPIAAANLPPAPTFSPDDIVAALRSIDSWTASGLDLVSARSLKSVMARSQALSLEKLAARSSVQFLSVYRRKHPCIGYASLRSRRGTSYPKVERRCSTDRHRDHNPPVHPQGAHPKSHTCHRRISCPSPARCRRPSPAVMSLRMKCVLLSRNTIRTTAATFSKLMSRTPLTRSVALRCWTVC
jgi:hypothetical protein